MGLRAVAQGVSALPTSTVGTGASVALADGVLTYSPAVTFGGSSTGITYTTQLGRYWKQGSLIFFAMQLVLSSKGAQTGTALVTLPIAAKTVTGMKWPAVFGRVASLGNVTTASWMASISSAATTIDMYSFAVGGSISLAADTDFANSTNMSLSGFYEY